MKVFRKAFLFLLLSFSMTATTAHANKDNFFIWLEELKKEAIAEGISSQTVEKALAGVSFDESVIELDRKQPEKLITFSEYVKNILSPLRIELGREKLEKHKNLLLEIQNIYGVPPQIVVALWGVESTYGQNTGDYEVIDSLASLAYEGRRAEFFRKELIETMRIIEEEKIDPYLLRGSWAGAMGQCQFMPSTYRLYAVDHDRNGRRDIWESEADVLASIANYLVAEGWKRGEGWLKETKSPAKINRKGRLIQPNGSSGRSFIVYDNFDVLMRWNRSTYFALSVGLLADEIAEKRNSL